MLPCLPYPCRLRAEGQQGELACSVRLMLPLDGAAPSAPAAWQPHPKAAAITQAARPQPPPHTRPHAVLLCSACVGQSKATTGSHGAHWGQPLQAAGAVAAGGRAHGLTIVAAEQLASCHVAWAARQQRLHKISATAPCAVREGHIPNRNLCIYHSEHWCISDDMAHERCRAYLSRLLPSFADGCAYSWLLLLLQTASQRCRIPTASSLLLST